MSLGVSSTDIAEKRPRWERLIIALVGVLVVVNILSRPFRGPDPAYDLGAVINALLNALVFDPGLFALAFWMLVAFTIGQEWQASKYPESEYQRNEFSCENCGDVCPTQDAYFVDSNLTNGEEQWCPHCVIENDITIESSSNP